MTLEAGARLGSYEILSPIGSGGMGEVYQAKDLDLGRTVAIKLLKIVDSERLRRFEQEARAASALNHPNIVTIYEVGNDAGTPYIAMEYVDGVTLRELLSGGALPHDKLIRYATEIASGLGKAHHAGIVHRDLKPENILVNEDGIVKILDFGLAKLQPTDEGSHLPTLDQRTTPGTIVGTVGYMSPEQAKGAATDFRSDQFSLGAILYEMATGKRAFERESAAQTMTAIIEDDPAPVTLSNPSVPGSVASVIGRCLSKDPEARFSSTRSIAQEIHREELKPLHDQPAGVSMAAVGAAGLLAIVLLMIVGLFAPEIREWVRGESEPENVAPPEAIQSIAVLPLDNLSGDPEQEYFVDGMTEALIASLAQIEELKVISRTSVMRFKGEQRLPLPEIAEQLDVEAIVEGSVLKADERVRITAQLIDTRTDEHLWAQSYEGDLEDVLTLQREVSVEIVREIRQTLSPASSLARLDVPPDAYDVYLRGRHFFSDRKLTEAIANYQEAVRIAPDYASAYVGMATCYASQRRTSLARTAVQQALELDPDLPEAQIPLAIVLAWEWKWAEAEAQFRRAIAANPNDGFVRHSFSLYLSRLGRDEEAITWQLEALQLDPLSPTINAELALRYSQAGRFVEAMDAAERATRLAPSFGHAYAQKAVLFIALERYEEALDAIDATQELGSFVIRPDMLRATVYARTGHMNEAREILRKLISQPEPNSIIVAFLLREVGEVQESYAWLERAFEERDPDLVAIAHNPYWGPSFRSDPRTRDLLRRMGLPEESIPN